MSGHSPTQAPPPGGRQDTADSEGLQDGPQDGLQEGERVAKALARAGVASRREVERYIEAGRVALNGRVLTTPAVKTAPGDILTVDGKVVSEPEATRLWRYHKPVGLMTTHLDPKGRPTVFEHLPPQLPRVISVGRLDLNSEGLLLLTNDGSLARALELPSTGLPRRYRARARGRITQDRLDRLKDGISVEGVAYGPIEARLDKVKDGDDGPRGANLWITVTLAEGKNREVRKVLEALGLTVNRLIRLAYGPFQLGVLAPGEVEEVGPRVIREQLAQHIAPESLPTGSGAGGGIIAKPSAAKAAAAARRTKTAPRRPAEDAAEAPPPRSRTGWAKAKPPADRHGAKSRPKAHTKTSGAKAASRKHWREGPGSEAAAAPARPAPRTPGRAAPKTPRKAPPRPGGGPKGKGPGGRAR